MVMYRPPKRRRVQEPFFPVEKFGEVGYPTTYNGPFRENILSFLRDYGEPEVCSMEGVSAWSFALQDTEGNRVDLRVFEERVQESRRLHCEHCRVIGWSHHPVSTRRYHFIIPLAEGEAEGSGVGKGRKLCPCCGAVIAASVKRCSACGAGTVKSGAPVLEAQTHLLHGLVHANGFGHLLRINGRERGSRFLTGRALMGLWDCLCGLLRARHVSVMDVSKKMGLDLRLLHGAAYGHPWYGRWGYTFAKGSYGIGRGKYLEALRAVRTVSLSAIWRHFAGIDEELLFIIATYQRRRPPLAPPLTNLGALLRFMLELLQKAPHDPQATPSSTGSAAKGAGSAGGGRAASSGGGSGEGRGSPSFSGGDGAEGGGPSQWGPSYAADAAATEDGGGDHRDDGRRRYPPQELERATAVLAEVLRGAEAGGSWMSRQDLRAATRRQLADFGPLNYALRSAVDKVVGDRIIRRSYGKAARAYVYRSEPLDGKTGLSGKKRPPEPPASVDATGVALPRAEIQKHLAHVFQNVLRGASKVARKGSVGEVAALPNAAQCILNTKQFTKDYRGEQPREAEGRQGGGGRGAEGGKARSLAEGPSGESEGEGRRGVGVEDGRGEEGGREGGKRRRGGEDEGWGRAGRREGGGEAEAEEVRVLCVVDLEDKDKMVGRNKGRDPPPELVLLPRGGTVGEFKEAASRALRAIYVILEAYQVHTIRQLAGVPDSAALQDHLPGGSTLLLAGSGADLASQARFEGGPDDWVVRCSCGTWDDDGERMVACDRCEVWQHTACARIPDRQSPPSSFLCRACGGELRQPGDVTGGNTAIEAHQELASP